MYKLRQATIYDIPALVQMGERFYNYAPYQDYIEYDSDSVTQSLTNILYNGYMAVAEHNVDGLVSIIAGVKSYMWFNLNQPIVSEMAWWVEDKHRKTTVAIRLYKMFANWAKTNNIKVIVMSDLVINDTTPAEKIFMKMGFKTIERSHIKRI